MADSAPDNRGPVLALVLLLMAGLLTVAWGAGREPVRQTGPGSTLGALPSAPASTPQDSSSRAAEPGQQTPEQTPAPAPTPTQVPTGTGPVRLPSGADRIFGSNRFLVAYYGTAGTGTLGVLGETSPDEMQRRASRAAAAFRGPGRPVQVVYELIVTIADPGPGPDGDFSHDIGRDQVRRYIRAAHRHGALLLLDIQPGRSDFLKVAQRWGWALEDPWVGLALDPEWRVPRGKVPGRVIGHVGAREINRTSEWLAALVREHDLPEKLFVLHQFRTSMIPDIDRVRSRPGLAMVHHVDGFGTRAQKLATYKAVERSDRFVMGMKLFYDEDVHRMGPVAVHAIRPRVRFVSYQ